jgi:DNA polymerase (family 10)
MTLKNAKEGKLKGLPGIQAKTEENILKGIAMIQTPAFIGRILPLPKEFWKAERKSPDKLHCRLRRWKETVKDIDILATSKDPHNVMDIFVHLQQVKEVLMKGPTKSSIVTNEGIQVDLRVVNEESFGAALAYFTGSKEHNIRLREMAVRKA